ncbi:phosphoribosylaminoimidazolesuccinocarboxamide synthase [Myroides sp. LJL115]
MRQNTITQTDFSFENQTSVYKGKVRDVYTIDHKYLVMVATDRLSAFDVVLPKGIPYKGQILNQIATRFMELTKDIVPNWLIGCPDPNVIVGKACTPFKVEMVIRGYLAGHAAREYQSGNRVICGVELPNGLKQNDKLPFPIITPSTKEDLGLHDMDISAEQIIQKGIVSQSDYAILEKYTRALFERGSEFALKQGLLLVDTKYEFGKTIDGEIVLIDEIHTPDSSRYFYADTYKGCQENNLPQKQLSKEFVREWLLEQGFSGKPGQKVPFMSQEYVESVSHRYMELYKHIMGCEFVKTDDSDPLARIQHNVETFFKEHREE